MSVPTFPSALKIGGRTYTVRREDRAAMSDERCVGSCNTTTGEIKVAVGGGFPADGQAECLVHEILHALLADSGTDRDRDTEESIVCILSPRLTAFLADNPEQVRAIMYFLGSGE